MHLATRDGACLQVAIAVAVAVAVAVAAAGWRIGDLKVYNLVVGGCGSLNGLSLFFFF